MSVFLCHFYTYLLIHRKVPVDFLYLWKQKINRIIMKKYDIVNRCTVPYYEAKTALARDTAYDCKIRC